MLVNFYLYVLNLITMHKFLLLFLCVTVLNVHGKPQVKSDKDALIEKFVQKETDRGKYYR